VCSVDMTKKKPLPTETGLLFTSKPARLPAPPPKIRTWGNAINKKTHHYSFNTINGWLRRWWSFGILKSLDIKKSPKMVVPWEAMDSNHNSGEVYHLPKRGESCMKQYNYRNIQKGHHDNYRQKQTRSHRKKGFLKDLRCKANKNRRREVNTKSKSLNLSQRLS